VLRCPPSPVPPMRRNEQTMMRTQANPTSVTHTYRMKFVCSQASNLTSHALKASDAPRQRHVFSHQRLTLAVDGAQDAVLHDADNVVLCGFLEHDESGGLEPQVRLVVLGNLFDESLQRPLGYEKLGRLLELPDLSQCDGAGAVAVRPLDAARWVSRLPMRRVMRALHRLLVLRRACRITNALVPPGLAPATAPELVTPLPAPDLVAPAAVDRARAAALPSRTALRAAHSARDARMPGANPFIRGPSRFFSPRAFKPAALLPARAGVGSGVTLRVAGVLVRPMAPASAQKMGGGDDQGYKMEGHGRLHDTVAEDIKHCEQSSYRVRIAYI